MVGQPPWTTDSCRLNLLSPAMRHCPKCQAKINVARFWRTTRWTPYRCPACGNEFQRVILPAVILVVIWSIVAYAIMIAGLFTQRIWAGAVALALWFGLLLWADWFFVPLRQSKT